MPKIVQQKVKSPSTNQSQTTFHNSNGELRGAGIKLLGYGRGKTGKTRLAATFPKPHMLIGTEDGTKSICDLGAAGRADSEYRLEDGTVLKSLLLRGKPTGVYFFRLASAAQLDLAVKLIAEKGFVSSCLDHAGGFQDILIREYKGWTDGDLVQRDYGMLQQGEWGVINTTFNAAMNRYLNLADKLGVDIDVVAHERNFKDDNGSDVMVPNVGAALTPGAAGWLNAACDYICQTYIRLKVRKETGTIAGVEQEVEIKTNEPEFCLRVGPHPVFSTGFRLSPGAVLPECIVDPTYEKILKVIRGEKL